MQRITKELDSLELQAKQPRQEIETIEFESNDLENTTLSADMIRDNFKIFKDVYDHLTYDEKYDLLHLLVKKVVYFEEEGKDKGGKKVGKIKMDLWELPAIDPSILSSAKKFAERHVWLPTRDSQRNFFRHHFSFMLNPVKKNHPRTEYKFQRISC